MFLLFLWPQFCFLQLSLPSDNLATSLFFFFFFFFFLILAVELCPLILQFFVFNCPFIHSPHFALYYLDLVFVSYMNGF
jgi:hypothetical protein